MRATKRLRCLPTGSRMKHTETFGLKGEIMGSQSIGVVGRVVALALASVSTAALAQNQSSADAASTLPSASVASQPATATPDTVQPTTSTSDTSAANQASKEIVITGIRGSLDKSVRIKRNSAVVL